MISNSTGVLVIMTIESQTRSVSFSVTSSDYYNISLTGNSVCSGNLTTSVTTDSEWLHSMCTLIIVITVTVDLSIFQLPALLVLMRLVLVSLILFRSDVYC